MVKAALIWLFSPPSITLRTCHIINNELKITKPAEMVRLNAGICKNILATTPTINTTTPTIRKRLKLPIFMLVRRATAAMVKNTAAVIAAAIPTILAPLLKLKLYCSKGLSNTPMPNVKTINKVTPVWL